MAKKSKIARENKIKLLVSRYLKQRKDLTSVVKSHTASTEEKMIAQKKLESLPRNSSATRYRNRCSETGRTRGFYRKFGLCRNMLRLYLMKGYLPGAKKASW